MRLSDYQVREIVERAEAARPRCLCLPWKTNHDNTRAFDKENSAKVQDISFEQDTLGYVINAVNNHEALCADLLAEREKSEALDEQQGKWVKWLVEAVEFPFGMQFELSDLPPCAPIELAGAWKAHDNDPDVYPEDYLTSMELELGKEYMQIWEFNARAALAAYRTEDDEDRQLLAEEVSIGA